MIRVRLWGFECMSTIVNHFFCTQHSVYRIQYTSDCQTIQYYRLMVLIPSVHICVVMSIVIFFYAHIPTPKIRYDCRFPIFINFVIKINKRLKQKGKRFPSLSTTKATVLSVGAFIYSRKKVCVITNNE